jgi:hypothetical protein
MTGGNTISLGPRHAEALLERLSKDNNAAGDQETYRLYFVDVDVLSTYVNGTSRDILSDWSSLFGLTRELREDDRPRVDEDAHALADAIAKSVGGFLMGRFRESRLMQSGQLWLTPEHSRELDSMIHAVLQEQPEQLGEWQEALYKSYEALSSETELAPQEVKQRLKDIFQSLRDNSPAGKIARAYDVRRRCTSVFTQSPIYPPQDLGRAFQMRGDTLPFERRHKQMALVALERHLSKFESSERSLQLRLALELTERKVFENFGPNVYVAEHVRRLEGDEEFQALLTDAAGDRGEWIRAAVRPAVRRVNDIFALARVVVLGEFLRDFHELAAPFAWRVCIVTGSRLMQTLLDDLKNLGFGKNVELVHPLSVMRFDEFLRPLSESDDTRTPGDEYALAVLGNPESAVAHLDAEKFMASLMSLLSTASAGFAYQHDRSLRHLHRLLKSNEANYGRILRAVGNAISSEFITTYLQVNQLRKPGIERLPSVCLPWVHLPLPEHEKNPAQSWIKDLHFHGIERRQPSRESSAFSLNDVQKADPTGYTTSVCAALGYLNMDREHLHSAEMAANIALRTAAISSDSENHAHYMPEGNEALYLAAFVSRMRVSAGARHRRAALEWRTLHVELINRATERALHWQTKHPELACSQDKNSGLQAIELIRLRYHVEDVARDVVCMVIDILGPRELNGISVERMWSGKSEELAKTVTDAVQTIRAEVKSNRKLAPNTEMAFIGAQLLVALIQFWVCERVQRELQGAGKAGVEAQLESLIIDARRLVPLHDSQLLRVLNIVFNEHCQVRTRESNPRRSARDGQYAKFAAIDELRGPFLERLAKLPRGESLSLALPQQTMDGRVNQASRTGA